MNVWQLLLVFEIALVSVVSIAVFIGWRRRARRVAQAHSPEHRLKVPDLWTDVPRAEHGTSVQMMRMKDDNFTMLRVRSESAQVLCSPQLEKKELFTELVSFAFTGSPAGHRRQQVVMIGELRKQIGFPQDVGQLREVAAGLSLPEQGRGA